MRHFVPKARSNLGTMRVFVSWAADHLGTQVGQSVMTDDVAEVRRVDQLFAQAGELWRSFALRCDGTVIEDGKGMGRIELGASYLSELPQIVRQYSEAVSVPVSAGIGMKMSQSAKALEDAKKKGNQIVLWHPDMEVEEPAELNKAVLAQNAGQGAGFAGHQVSHRVIDRHPDHEQGEEIKKLVRKNPAPKFDQPSAYELEESLHNEASKQGEKDQAATQQNDNTKDQLKQQLGKILTVIRAKAPIIAQIQQADPEAYQSVMALVQGVIALAREVLPTAPPASEGQAPVQKSEELEKAISQLPKGKALTPRTLDSVDGFTKFSESHDYSHLLPEQAQQEGMKLHVTHHGFQFSRGDVSDQTFSARLKHPTLRDENALPEAPDDVGYVDGIVREGYNFDNPNHITKHVEPHSWLHPELHGKGIGTAMYEAVYAHAHSMGFRKVQGGKHTAMADALHKRLAKKHGFNYDPEEGPDTDFPFGDYGYTLKQELEPVISEEHYIGPGKGIVFQKEEAQAKAEDEYSQSPADKAKDGELDKSGGPIPGQPKHVRLGLPVGSQVNGKTKVKHSDGGESWIEMRSGAVQSDDANAPLFGMNSHPASALRPSENKKK